MCRWESFHTRRTTGKLWKSSTRVVVSNMARREKHHRMEMCGILQLINWQKSSDTHCFFFCLALLPLWSWIDIEKILITISLSLSSTARLCPYTAYMCEKKRQDNDWNSHKEHEGHTRTFDGVEKVARGSLSTSAKCFYMVELCHLSVWVPAHLHFNILDWHDSVIYVFIPNSYSNCWQKARKLRLFL